MPADVSAGQVCRSPSFDEQVTVTGCANSGPEHVTSRSATEATIQKSSLSITLTYSVSSTSFHLLRGLLPRDEIARPLRFPSSRGGVDAPSNVRKARPGWLDNILTTPSAPASERGLFLNRRSHPSSGGGESQHPCRFMPRLLLLIVLMAPFASAQRQFTLSVDTQLVVETVTVRDKDNKPIENLRADDFVVTEDGVPQTISVFQFERLQDATTPAAVEAPKPVQVLKPNQITPPPAGDPRYTNRRLLVLFFDMTSTPPPDQFRAFSAGEKFIQTQMTGPDLMAIMTFSDGAVKVQK